MINMKKILPIAVYEIFAIFLIFTCFVFFLTGCGDTSGDVVFDLDRRVQAGLQEPPDGAGSSDSGLGSGLDSGFGGYSATPGTSGSDNPNSPEASGNSPVSPPSQPREPFIFPDTLDMDNIVHIGERFFVNQLLEVLLNSRQYMGRVIRYEGMFFTVPWVDDFYIVYRYMFGCCGELDKIGFEVMPGEFEPFPNGTWVEVVGMLDTDGDILVLRVISLTELDEPGEAFVS